MRGRGRRGRPGAARVAATIYATSAASAYSLAHRQHSLDSGGPVRRPDVVERERNQLSGKRRMERFSRYFWDA
jgi:hypothetical protein